LEDFFQTPGSCHTQQQEIAVQNRVQTVRDNVLRDGDKFPENIEKIVAAPGLGVDRDGVLEKKRTGSGEFANLECRQGVAMALTLLRWQRQLNTVHYGIASAQVWDFCEDPSTGGQGYLEFIRSGEK
jgi:hypothetical protein